MAVQCALLKGKTRTTWNIKTWIVHHHFSDLYSNQFVLPKTSRLQLTWAPCPGASAELRCLMFCQAFFSKQPCTEEFWRHDPYLCILGHSNMNQNNVNQQHEHSTTFLCLWYQSAATKLQSDSWMRSHLLGTTVHLMSDPLHRLKYL